MIMDQYFFNVSHEWLKNEHDDVFLLGISDYAQKALGDIVYFECTLQNKSLESGSSCAVVESVKSASDIYMPVCGEIIAINNEVVLHPEIINKSPYEDGWLIKIKIKNIADVHKLLSYTDYTNKY
jgi:glycine cleavage system H protein